MRKEYLLPGLTVTGGIVGFILRRWELATAFEPGTNLPVAGVPATWALIVLSLLMAGVLLLLCAGRHFAFSGGYNQAFRAPSPLYATATITAGFLLGAGGVINLIQLPSALQDYSNLTPFRALMAALPKLLMPILCVAAAVCVVLIAKNNYRGERKGTRSVLLLVPAYTCCLWLIIAYQANAADPVLIDYVYHLLAIIAILLALYFMAGFSFESVNVTRVAYCALMGVYLSAVALADSHDLSILLFFAFAITYLTASATVLLGNDRRMLVAWRAEHPMKEGSAEMDQKEKYYITTPIYYPSDKLHIGHTYCTVATDAMARYKRLQGYDVMFLTGTDEHGQKIEEKAKDAGVTPQAFVDNVVAGKDGILALWKLMNISNDRFIRTTDDYHVAAIQKIFKTLYDKGDIYKSVYKGKYCTPCESFWTETQLVDGKCPDCGREVKDAQEEAYFFRLSNYTDRILKLYEEHPDFLEPVSRVNEMVNNFLKPGLEDLCVSRTSFTWGVPVDFDPGHVVYVWVDALSNYITALGYENDKYDDYDKYWPAAVHFVGKEIVRFHAIIWPALLMAQGLPLPKKVYGHGWLLLEGGKMSKSKGNVVDPVVLVDRYGVDALRYFLLREFPFGSDGAFSNELLISRINTDLANDLGNLLSRTTAMVEKYFGGTLPTVQTAEPADAELLSMATALRESYACQMEKFAFQNALIEVFKVVSRANKYIDETAPWMLAKDEAMKPRLARVMYNLLESLRICGVLLTPFMPDSCVKLFAQIGAGSDITNWEAARQWGMLPVTATVTKGESLFPRIDMNKELAQLEAAGAPAVADPEEVPSAPPIVFDDFVKVEMTVCKVLSCEKVKKSDKLLCFQLDDGSGTNRQILSGIAKFYAPEDLLGKTVVACTNLAPRKMMGKESCGMLLSAEKGDKLNLLLLSDAIPAGAKLR